MRSVPALLLFSDSERSPAMRHEVPVAIGDPFLFVEVDGRIAWGSEDLLLVTAGGCETLTRFPHELMPGAVNAGIQIGFCGDSYP